jgi:hypothetical protein
MGFGAGLGAVIGGNMAAEHLEEGVDKVNGIATGFGSSVAPYNQFGQSFLDQATVSANNLEGTAHNVKQYDDFMKDYQTSDAAKYAINQGTEAVNNSAAAKGKLLSGGNERALATMQQGISSQFANQAYGQYLAGNAQQFGQLEASLGNMFRAIGVGGSQMNANASLAADQAKNDQSKGSGFGSLFDGLGSLATMF